jgi:hypothetical protein
MPVTSDELKLWLADTISEGDHSFTDLRDCIIANRNEVSADEFYKAANDLFAEGCIAIYPYGKDKKIGAIDFEISAQLISRYSEIIAEEAANGVLYVYEITESGMQYLRDNGFTGAI